MDDAPALDFDITCALALAEMDKKSLEKSLEAGTAGQGQRFHEASIMPRAPKVTLRTTADLENYLRSNPDD